MLYLLAILLPPLACLFAGRPGAAVLNCLLCCALWVPGIIHALLVVSEAKADRRMDRLGRTLRRPLR